MGRIKWDSRSFSFSWQVIQALLLPWCWYELSRHDTSLWDVGEGKRVTRGVCLGLKPVGGKNVSSPQDSKQVDLCLGCNSIGGHTIRYMLCNLLPLLSGWWWPSLCNLWMTGLQKATCPTSTPRWSHRVMPPKHLARSGLHVQRAGDLCWHVNLFMLYTLLLFDMQISLDKLPCTSA